MVNLEAAHTVLFQRRVLLCVTVFLGIGFIFWIVAISTSYWHVINGGNGLYVPKTQRYFLQSHAGIWKSCRTVYDNKTKPAARIDTCANHELFPKGKDVNLTYLDYQRTVAAFSIISLLIMIMGIAFSIYTFYQTRYMYKRLTACSHLVAAGCVLIVIEVSVSLTQYGENNLPVRHPPGSTWNYGFSFVLAWITFLSQVAGAVAFALCSRKRKKDKAPDDRFAIEEEPTIIGR